jgi:hypothetical protein
VSVAAGELAAGVAAVSGRRSPAAGEVVRRISGKSLGRYWREEVAEPLGVDCHISLAAEHDARVAEFIPIPPGEPDLEAELLKNAGPMVLKALNTRRIRSPT